MGHEPEWKVEKQPRWLVAAIKKTISSLHGGYEEAAEWLDVTKDALFNRLRTGGDQIFPIGWALVSIVLVVSIVWKAGYSGGMAVSGRIQSGTANR